MKQIFALEDQSGKCFFIGASNSAEGRMYGWPRNFESGRQRKLVQEMVKRGDPIPKLHILEWCENERIDARKGYWEDKLCGRGKVDWSAVPEIRASPPGATKTALNLRAVVERISADLLDPSTTWVAGLLFAAGAELRKALAEADGIALRRLPGDWPSKGAPKGWEAGARLHELAAPDPEGDRLRASVAHKMERLNKQRAEMGLPPATLDSIKPPKVATRPKMSLSLEAQEERLEQMIEAGSTPELVAGLEKVKRLLAEERSAPPSENGPAAADAAAREQRRREDAEAARLSDPRGIVAGEATEGEEVASVTDDIGGNYEE